MYLKPLCPGLQKSAVTKGEFLFCYEQTGAPINRPPASDHIKMVLNSYQELLNKSYSLMDEEQIDRIESILSQKKRIYVYGKGSSGLVGMEMKLRFMRIGVNLEAITDDHIMKMNSVLVDEDCAVIGISVSGKTAEVIESLKAAKRCGATTVLMTSHIDKQFKMKLTKEHLDQQMNSLAVRAAQKQISPWASAITSFISASAQAAPSMSDSFSGLFGG